MATILIISTVKSNMFIEPLAKRLMKEHVVWRYSILEAKLYCYNDDTSTNIFKKFNKWSLLFSGHRLKKMIKSIDAVHYHYITNHSIMIHLGAFFFTKSKKIATLWGSDFYNSKRSYLRKKFYSNVDVVTFTNSITEKEFRKLYKSKKTATIRFGLPSLEDIKTLTASHVLKNSLNLNIPKGLLVVCVGTNGSSNQNHFKIIDELQRLETKDLNKLFFLFPVGYPMNNDSYIDQLIDKMNQTSIKNFYFDKTFYSGKKLALYRSIPQLLIQLQTTDQFSGAMQEMMCAGVNVLTGSWLPYKVLDDENVFYNKIDNFEDLPQAIIEMINNPLVETQKMHNKEVIYKLSSWNHVIKEWKKLYIEE